MNILLRGIALAAAVAIGPNLAYAQDWQDSDYALSMAGALINDHCGREWQNGEYISVHACNYRFSNLFNSEISTQHFDACRTLARGDIVMIADCMVERFGSWLDEQGQ
ncbi:MAG: hypothetical protein DHS20C12_30660 [Pseudohongiella sp.]|nr:MAG: hypothetical protein DHS20C12_30660 [Pseudohongiella sp.]